jgi:hypothetical protein
MEEVLNGRVKIQDRAARIKFNRRMTNLIDEWKQIAGKNGRMIFWPTRYIRQTIRRWCLCPVSIQWRCDTE